MLSSIERADDQADALATFLRSVAEWDRVTSQLRGAVAAMDRSGLRRVDVWRVLQCIADRYRDGLPLDQRLWFLQIADAVLTPKLGQNVTREVLVAANVANGSKSSWARQLVRKEVSKARKRIKVLPALPAEVLAPADYEAAHVRWWTGSDEESRAASQILDQEEKAVKGHERRVRSMERRKRNVTTPR